MLLYCCGGLGAPTTCFILQWPGGRTALLLQMMRSAANKLSTINGPDSILTLYSDNFNWTNVPLEVLGKRQRI
jgi:hypothetical protein